jgi:phage terminase large subunit
MTTLDIQTPRVFAPLLAPSRYKAAHGGRGSGKSHFFAEMLVERALMQRGLRAVCIREIQKSLEQSVMRLIEDKIAALGVARQFDVLKTEIRTPGGGLIIFQGMQNHTAESIKSLEGYDVAWVEEAQSLSKRSLTLLRPTIRKPGSEIWFSWNPEAATDPVDELLRGPNPISPAVVEANWRDNPWFPAVLEDERREDLARNPDEYEHVWEGGYLTITEAVIFRNRVTVEAFETPSDARLHFGADFGFAADPATLIRFWIKDDCLFVDHEACEQGVEIDDLPAMYAGGTSSDGKTEFPGVAGSRQWPIKADNARPETISYLARHNFRIAAAAKWPGSIEDGIAHMKGFKRIVVHERCRHTAKEFRLYSFKVDAKTGDVLPVIVDKHNHCIDAIRYGLDGIIRRRGPATAQPLRL